MPSGSVLQDLKTRLPCANEGRDHPVMMYSETRGHTKCRRCTLTFATHGKEDRACPNGSGDVFQKHVPRIAASQSFCPGEVWVLDYIVSALLRGGTVQTVTRNKHFPAVVKKVFKMRDRVSEMKQERGREEKEKVSNGSAAGSGAEEEATEAG